MISGQGHDIDGYNSSGFKITEVPGQLATREQLSMFYTRYKFAEAYCVDKEVLEVACGSGQGLGYLSRRAKYVCGGDIDKKVLPIPKRQYQNSDNIEVMWMDAHELPFESESFDILIIFDSIYWLKDQNVFLQEAYRVLRPNGRLLISTVNREWSGFIPSPFSTKYLNVHELSSMLITGGFQVELFVSYRERQDTVVSKTVLWMRKMAKKLGLVPTSIRAKEILKKVFYGGLTPIPAEVQDGMALYEKPITINDSTDTKNYKMIYAVGTVMK